MSLVNEGLNDCEVARLTGIPRGTIRDWRRGHSKARRTNDRGACAICGHPAHDFGELPGGDYAYLLGMYLGDGHISRYARTRRLRVSLDMTWPGIMLDCANAMQAVFPENRVSFSQPDPNAACAVASVYSRQLACLFPQCGPGPKHLRRLWLDDWQQAIVDEHPKQFIRGLIHSDGCRFLNRVRVNGKDYAYPSYNFTNASDDIRRMFTDACDRLGIQWRRMNARNVSVARRGSVALLDEFVGPKN